MATIHLPHIPHADATPTRSRVAPGKRPGNKIMPAPFLPAGYWFGLLLPAFIWLILIFVLLATS
jgi:hypothetical protein